VINEKGEQLGLLSVRDALVAAREAGLDLVEVAPDTNPPVCKFLDYGKFKYRQKKKSHSAVAHRVHLKEIRLTAAIGEHDFRVKAKKVREFLEKGDKVLVTLRFFGRQVSHQEIGMGLMNRLLAELEDIVKVDRPPILEGRRITMSVVPK
jgi:translation initiation factor IF-3